MKRKKGFSGGFFQGMNLQARLGEAAFLSMLLKYKEEKGYVSDGHETWEAFCQEELGLSDETMRRRFKALESFGPETTRAMINLGLSWKDVRAIDHVLTEEQKTQLKKGVLEIEGRKIPVREDTAPEVLAAVDLLIERAATAKKSEELAEKKLSGIEREHKKEVKAMAHEIEGLKAMLPSGEDDAEWAEKFIAEILDRAQQWDLSLRTLAFHKKTFADPVIQAKIAGALEQMRTRFEQFSADFDAYITGDGE